MIGTVDKTPDRNAKAFVRDVMVIAGPACLKAAMKRVYAGNSSFY